MRHFALTAFATILILALVSLHSSTDGFVLQESGRFSGAGYHELSASGPLCCIVIRPANESLLAASNGTIRIVQQNGSLKEVV
jgi:hypothetical protein